MKGSKLLYSGIALLSLTFSVFLANFQEVRANHICVPFYCHNEIPAGPSTYSIDVSNNCYKPIRVAIMTYSPGSTRGGATGNSSGVTQYVEPKWIPQGWWEVGSGSTIRLKNGIRKRSFYYYAESRDGTSSWAGSTYRSLYGRSLPFMSVDVNSVLSVVFHSPPSKKD